MDPSVYIGFRVITSFILFVTLFLLVDFGYIVAPLCMVIYYYLVEAIFLDFNINRKAKEYEADAICYFPVFLISLRCSRSVKKALTVTNKIVKTKLSVEFDRVLKDVAIGKSLQEALGMCIERMPSGIIVNILVSLIEADRLGNNIDKSVTIQLDYLKDVNKKKILHNYSMISLKLIFVFFSYMILFLGALLGITYLLSFL